MSANKKSNSRGQGSILHLKDGRYRLRICDGTKVIVDKKTGLPKTIKNTKDFFGHSQKEVRDKRDAWLKRKEEEENRTPYEQRLLLECIFEWVDTVKKLTLKAQSLSRIVQVTEDYISPRLGIYRIYQIDTDIIQIHLINNLVDNGYSYSTIKKTVNVLTGFYRWAVGTRKVTFNPCLALVMPSEQRLREESGDLGEIKYYSYDDLIKLREAADAKNKYCHELGNAEDTYRYPRAMTFLFIAYTGLRCGEALALKWSDYDPERKTISITKDVAEYVEIGTRRVITKIQLSPKTSSSRRVLTLNDEVVEMLDLIKKRSFNPESEFIICNRRKNGVKQFVAPSNYRASFKRFCEFAGVDYKGIHALRHTFASMMFAQGVDIKLISVWLGHSSVQTTYDIYTHVMDDVGYKNRNVIPAIKIKRKNDDNQ